MSLKKLPRYWLRRKRKPTLTEITISVIALILWVAVVIPVLIEHERGKSPAFTRNACPVQDVRLDPFEHELQNRYCEVVALRGS